MPDHLHALVCPLKNREAKIKQFSAGLKRFVRSETQAAWKWQDGVFDRLLRKNEFAEFNGSIFGKTSFARGWSSDGKIGRT